MAIKIIIAGGRDFNDYSLLVEKVTEVISLTADLDEDFEIIKNEIEIVSGCAKGADTLGIKFAEEFGYNLKKFPPNWEKHGKSAGFKRNIQMAEYADILIAFWDGKSKGTRHMIDTANEYGLDTWKYNI